MEKWRSAERSQVEALLEIRQTLAVGKEDRLGESSASRRVQNPRDLATLLDRVCSRSCNKFDNGLTMPVNSLQEGNTGASLTFGSDVIGDFSEAFVYDQLVAIGHVHQPGICRGIETCGQE
jgi:hypothetical protein